MRKLRLFLMTMLLSVVSTNSFAYVAGDRIVHEGLTYYVIDASKLALRLLSATGAEGSSVEIPGTFNDGADATFTVTEIGDGNAVSWPSTVTSITLPNTMKTIRYNAFLGSKITTINIPASVTSVAGTAFLALTTLQSITVDAGSTTYKAVDGALYSLDNGSLNALVCFPRAKELTDGEIHVAEGAKTIVNCAISYMTNVKKIYLPASLEDFPMKENKNNFMPIYNCSNLEYIEVDNTNTHFCDVNGVMFDKAMTTLIFYPRGKADDSYTVPEGVTTIGTYGCYSAKFKSIDLNDVTTLEYYALQSCNNLTDVTIPAGMTTIPEGAISGNKIENYYVAEGNPNYAGIDGVLFTKSKKTLLQFPRGRKGSYTVPEGTDTIGANSFQLAKVTEVTLPTTVVAINDHAFANNKLTSFTVPEGVKTIGYRAFAYSYSFESIKISSTVETLDNETFRDCTKFSSFTCAENPSLKNISNMCFMNCESLTSITIPKSVETIGSNAFQSCI